MSSERGREASVLQLVFLWLAAAALRETLLAVPPLLPAIHRDLQLSEAGVAAVSSVPVLMMGLAASSGSLLVARFGARRALVGGLLVIAVGSALRGAGANAAVLLVMTAVMGIGIAVSQPTFSALVRQWFPGQITRATGVWSNGLLMGELLGAALTLPLVLPLAGGRWEGALALWSVPVLLALVLILLGTPHVHAEAAAFRGSGWPDWRNPRLLRLGLFQASAGLIYFGANTFIPDYLTQRGQADLITPALTALNAAQVPASAVIGLLPWRRLTHPASLLGLSALMALALVGLVSAQTLPLLLGAAMLGFGAAYILVIAFAVPGLLAPPADVPRWSAGMFTISYASAFLVNLAGGAAWDATHQPATAFVPVLLGIVLALSSVGTIRAAPGESPVSSRQAPVR